LSRSKNTPGFGFKTTDQGNRVRDTRIGKGFYLKPARNISDLLVAAGLDENGNRLAGLSASGHSVRVQP
jgi:hypothetical protein